MCQRRLGNIWQRRILFDHCYDSGGYEDFIDYHRAAVPPLHGSDAEWVALRLQQCGKR
jgi:hypothetical protein